MKKELKLVDNAKKTVVKHKAKVALTKKKNSDELNLEASKKIMTPEENFEFNSKMEIPDDMELYFKDGSAKNDKFSNLAIRKKKI